MIFTVVVLLAGAVGAYGQTVGVCHIITNHLIARSEFALKEDCQLLASQATCTEADFSLSPGENAVEVTFGIQHDLMTQQTCVGKNTCTVGKYTGKCMTREECGGNHFVQPDAAIYDGSEGYDFKYCPHDSKDYSCCVESGAAGGLKSQAECANCDGVDYLCNSGFFCAGGLCFPDGFPFPLGVGLRKTLGESCCDDQQCESENCLGGQCSCTTDAECESDEYCGTTDCSSDGNTANLCQSKHDKCDCCLDQGWCKDPVSGADALVCDISEELCIVPLSVEENGACCSSEECKAPSDFCCSGNCAVRNSKEVEETCDCDEECKSGSCKNGACECTDDYQCPDVNGVDYYCDKGWFFFLGRNSCKPMKEVCDKCERDAECLSGNCKWFKCIEGNENYALGEACCRDAQCAGDLSCSSGGQCQCTEDDHCPGVNQYCDKGFLGIGQNVCRTQKPECARCGRDSHCLSPGVCSWFKCAIANSAPAIGSPCCRDVQCAEGNCNNAGVCHCTENYHCPSGEYCDEGFLGIGKNKCRPLKADCEGCTLDSQCAGDCKFFKCATANVAPSIGSSCCRDHQCAVGNCNSANVCQCTSDSHCPGGRCAVGFLGIGKNKCVPYKSECQSCLFNSQCGPTAECRVGKCATHHSLGKSASCCRDYQCINGNCKWPSRKCN